MSDHEFRHGDKYQLLAIREYIRDNFPNGCAGFVAEDLDLVIRHYGARYKTDGVGRFMLIEVKSHKGHFNIAQKKTFGMIDDLLRKADPRRERYMGFYLIWTAKMEWADCSEFVVNGRTLTKDEFNSFMNGDLEIPGYWDKAKHNERKTDGMQCIPEKVERRQQAGQRGQSGSPNITDDRNAVPGPARENAGRPDQW